MILSAARFRVMALGNGLRSSVMVLQVNILRLILRQSKAKTEKITFSTFVALKLSVLKLNKMSTQ